MKRVSLILLVTTVVLSSVAGHSQERERGTYGPGPIRADNGRVGTDRERTTVYGQWLLGYLTAASLRATTPPRKTDSAAVLAFVTRSCTNHPLNDIGAAAEQLVAELGGRW